MNVINADFKTTCKIMILWFKKFNISYDIAETIIKNLNNEDIYELYFHFYNKYLLDSNITHIDLSIIEFIFSDEAEKLRINNIMYMERSIKSLIILCQKNIRIINAKGEDILLLHYLLNDIRFFNYDKRIVCRFRSVFIYYFDDIIDCCKQNNIRFDHANILINNFKKMKFKTLDNLLQNDCKNYYYKLDNNTIPIDSKYNSKLNFLRDTIWVKPNITEFTFNTDLKYNCELHILYYKETYFYCKSVENLYGTHYFNINFSTYYTIKKVVPTFNVKKSSYFKEKSELFCLIKLYNPDICKMSNSEVKLLLDEKMANMKIK